MSAGSTSNREPLCSRCLALCCRLTVVLGSDERIPAEYTEHNAQGLRVMAHDTSGWCVAVDHATMSCSIYAQRPEQCRRFKMGGPYCLALRAENGNAVRDDALLVQSDT